MSTSSRPSSTAAAEGAYRTLFEASPQPMWVLDRDTLAFLAVNDAALARYGYSREEFLAMTAKDIRPEEDLSAFLEAVQKGEEGEERQGVWRHRTRDGRILRVDIISKRITFEGRPAKLVLSRNVTSQLAFDGGDASLLDEGESRFRRAFAGAATGIAITKVDGRFEYANPAYRAILGYPDDELLGLSLPSLLHPDDVAGHEGLMIELLTGERDSFVLEMRGLRKDGSVAWVRTSVSMLWSPRDEPPHVMHVTEDVTEQKETTARLLESRKLLSIAGQIARVGGWMADLGEGTVHWSDEVCAIHDAPPGTTVSIEEAIEFCAPEWRTLFREHFTACAEKGEPFDLELEILTREEHRLWVRSIGEPVRGPDGAIESVQGAFQDLSSQKKAQAEIRTLAARLSRILESITDALFTLDRKWRITYLNSEAERMLERTREELLGTVIWEAFPEALGTPFEEGYRAAMEGGEAVHFEARYPTVDRWWSVHAYPSEEGLSVYSQDITDRRAAERALRESEERFRSVSQAMTDAVWDWDLRTGSLWWSDGLTALFGVTPEEAGAELSVWSERIHPDDRERVVAGLEAVVDGDGVEWEDEYRFRTASGTLALVQDRGFVLRDERGKAVHMVGGMTDVTERRELEERLRHSQKMEAVGRLAGGVAHDFNNLLTVIQGQADLLLDDLPDPSPLREEIQQIRKEVARGAGLTRQLLAFSRNQVLENKVVDLERTVADLQPMLRRVIPARIELEFVASGERCLARVDPGQMRQVILNLAVNAQDAIDQEGRIRFEVDVATLTESDIAELPWTAEPGRYVDLSVRDTGSGMTPAVLERIFEPFFTTKPEGQGTGLGLSMVFGIIKQSGGHILVESRPGEGSTFRLLLPLVTGEEPEPEQSDEKAPRPARGNETVLLVEDDPSVRRVATRVLERSGYTVLTGANGEEGLRVLHEEGARIDLVVSDIVMPEMGGSEFVDRLREIRPDLNVVLMSGYSEEELSVGVRHKAAAFLEKPFAPEELSRIVRETLAG